jgi:DNA-directed RNA polymerase specialized sigma24 family protein
MLFHDLPLDAEERPERIVVLEEALSQLEAQDKRLAGAVHQFYFVGYTTAEMALFNGVSEKTIDRDLKRARIVLRQFMEEVLKSQR